MDCDADPLEGTQRHRFRPAASSQRIARVVWPPRWGCSGCGFCTGFFRRSPGPRSSRSRSGPSTGGWSGRSRGAAIGSWRRCRTTLVVGLVLIGPLVYAAIEVARESGSFIQYIGEARHNGLPMPSWLPRFQPSGTPVAEWWQANLSDPQTMKEFLGRIYKHIPAGIGEPTRRRDRPPADHLWIYPADLVFPVSRRRCPQRAQLLDLSHRVLGPSGERVARHMIAAVHGTVTGLVLVGLAEGVLLGFAYALAGLPHPVSFAALTGVVAVIPFGAPVAFCAAGLYLLASGSTVAAAVVVGFGFLVVFVADHFVRPFLIGGAARLPFLWVLLGIIGGLETFGLLGLFLGPVVMAALISLWREWTQPPEPSDDPPGATAATRRR